MAESICVRNGSMTYGDASVLQHVTHCFRGGSVTLVLGNNGSGKTMLLEMIAGLRPPSTGEVLVGGVSLWKDGKPDRELLLHYGVAFQHPEQQLFARSIREEFAYTLKPYRWEKARRDEAIERTIGEVMGSGAESWLTRDPFTLSGGQQRRLAQGLTTAADPDWLLLDEPTSGCDHEAAQLLVQLIQERKARGKGAIIVTHDLDTLFGIADEIILLREGQLVWSGEPARLVDEPEGFAAAGMTLPERLHVTSQLRSAGFALPAGWLKPDDVAARLIEHRAHAGGAEVTAVDSMQLAATGSPRNALADSVQPAMAGSPQNALAVSPIASIIRFDPRSLWLAYMVVSPGILLQSSWFGWGLGALLALGAIRLTKIPYHLWSKPAIVLLVFTLVTTVTAGIGWDEGITFASAQAAGTFYYFSKLMMVMLIGFALLYGIPPLRLKRALEQGLSGMRKFRVPVDQFAMTAALMVRFIPLLFQLWHRFSRIAAARGKVALHPGKVPFTQIRVILLPFLLALFRLGENVTLTLLTRGVGRAGYQPTQAYRLAFTRQDAIFVGLSVLLLGGMLAVEFVARNMSG